jgi:hypothetical protein
MPGVGWMGLRREPRGEINDERVTLWIDSFSFTIFKNILYCDCKLIIQSAYLIGQLNIAFVFGKTGVISLDLLQFFLSVQSRNFRLGGKP